MNLPLRLGCTTLAARRRRWHTNLDRANFQPPPRDAFDRDIIFAMASLATMMTISNAGGSDDVIELTSEEEDEDENINSEEDKLEVDDTAVLCVRTTLRIQVVVFSNQCYIL
jgi:hypothetical protein